MTTKTKPKSKQSVINSNSNLDLVSGLRYIIMKCANESTANSNYGKVIGFCNSLSEMETKLRRDEKTKLMWRGKGVVNDYVQADNGFYYSLVPIDQKALVGA